MLFYALLPKVLAFITSLKHIFDCFGGVLNVEDKGNDLVKRVQDKSELIDGLTP